MLGGALSPSSSPFRQRACSLVDATAGIEGIGDYGAFWYMCAVAGGYYADASGGGAAAYAQVRASPFEAARLL